MMLEGGALQSADFAGWSKDYVLFCHVTSQLKSAKHDTLLAEKGGGGFPYLIFMDAEGDVLARHVGMPEAAGLSATARNAAGFVELKKKAAKGDKGAKAEVLLHQLEFGQVSAEEAKTSAKTLALKPDQKSRFELLLSGAEVRDVLKTIGPDRSTRLAAGKRFLEMKKAGKPAPAGDGEFQAYCLLIMEAAEAGKDAKTFEEAYGAMQKKYGNALSPQFRKMQDDRLAKLKAAGGK